MAITFVTPRVTGSLTDNEHKFAACGTWLQVQHDNLEWVKLLILLLKVILLLHPGTSSRHSGPIIYWVNHKHYDKVLYCTNGVHPIWQLFRGCTVLPNGQIVTFRLQYEDDYEYEFSVLSTRFRFGGRKFSKCVCSELKTLTHSHPRTPI